MSQPVWPDLAVARPVDLWAGHDRSRLDWAFRAYDQFVSALSPEIRERLAHKDKQAEPYVVVFGKTQVGKTTLLLELMGVTSEQSARISRVLRGGQAKGKSATATAMEYRRADDGRWGLRLDDNPVSWFDVDSAMEAALSQLRQQMEASQLVAQGPCMVYLPVDCFDGSIGQPQVRMLDLPGDKPANAAEQAHVNAMARKYVPLADLILLVGRGDDLSFLQEGTLTLPGIEDWQSAPRRFKIVTTYSYTAQSVRDLLRQPAQADLQEEVQQYRSRLIEEIQRSTPLSKAAQQPGMYFPLEFGQSWQGTRAQALDIYQRATPLIDYLRQQLLADIHASTTPLARLRAAVDAHIVIASVKQKRLAAMQKITAELEESLRLARDELTNAQAAFKHAGKACDRLAAMLALVTPERLDDELHKHVQLPAIAQDRPGKNVTAFKVRVQDTKAKLLAWITASRPSGAQLGDTATFWRTVEVEPDLDQANAILDDAFREFLVVLGAYWFDTYLRTGPYENDIFLLKQFTDQACAEMAELARTAWRAAAMKNRAKGLRQLHAETLKQATWSKLAVEGDNACKNLAKALARHVAMQAQFEARMAADLRESERFAALLDDAYLAELQQRRARIAADDQPVSAFLGLMAAFQLAQSRQQVLLQMDHIQA